MVGAGSRMDGCERMASQDELASAREAQDACMAGAMHGGALYACGGGAAARAVGYQMPAWDRGSVCGASMEAGCGDKAGAWQPVTLMLYFLRAIATWMLIQMLCCFMVCACGRLLRHRVRAQRPTSRRSGRGRGGWRP